MNLLVDFYQRGAEDADRRVAKALSPPRRIAAADRYVMSSVLVGSLDRLTHALHALVSNSRTARAAAAARNAWQHAGWRERYRTISLVLIVSVAVHLVGIAAHGRPDWFRLIVPLLAGAFAVLLLVASRSTHEPG